MKKKLSIIEKIDLSNPIVLIDIGARWGVQRPWNNFPEKKLKYFGFDADEDECKRLNAENKYKNSVVYLPDAIFDKDSNATLYLTNEEGCSSIYQPNYDIINRYYLKENWVIKKEIKIKTTTLKKVFDKNKIKPDFIKIDTQGAELNILQGAGHYLDGVLGLELEVEFQEVYKGQPLFSDIDAYVRKKGFELFDLNRYWANRINKDKYHLNRGQIVFGDAIYFRSTDSFYSLKMDSDKQCERLLKMVQVLSVYGFYDVAADYINHELSPLNNQEKGLTLKALSDVSKIPVWQKILFNNKFAGKAGRLLKLLGNLLSFTLNTYGWGTDYNGIDGREPYFRKEGRYFKNK